MPNLCLSDPLCFAAGDSHPARDTSPRWDAERDRTDVPAAALPVLLRAQELWADAVRPISSIEPSNMFQWGISRRSFRARKILL